MQELHKFMLIVHLKETPLTLFVALSIRNRISSTLYFDHPICVANNSFVILALWLEIQGVNKQHPWTSNNSLMRPLLFSLRSTNNSYGQQQFWHSRANSSANDFLSSHIPSHLHSFCYLTQASHKTHKSTTGRQAGRPTLLACQRKYLQVQLTYQPTSHGITSIQMCESTQLVVQGFFFPKNTYLIFQSISRYLILLHI